MRFLLNDPDYAPFDIVWLRGITPMRLVVLAAICAMTALSVQIFNFARVGLAAATVNWLLGTMDTFIAAAVMFVIVVRTDVLTARSSPRVRITALATAVIVGALAYAAIRWSQRYWHTSYFGIHGSQWYGIGASVFRAIAMGGLLVAILHFAARERDSARDLHRARLSEIEVEKQIAEARLNLLRAQIEPHFLFNSLASVKRLYERDAGRGRALLDNLMDYLRAATRGARQRETRLGDEIALAESFIAIFKVRMGDRLRIRIDVPAEVQSAQVPPLMVGTLVENAIKHGLGPRASGGTLTLAARRRGDVLEVEVGDDGAGFRARSGRGVGLANTRARLESLFGGAGTLDLAANPGGGVTATMRLPFRLAAEVPQPA